MVTTLIVLLLVLGAAFWLIRQRTATQQGAMADAKSEARRWVERLGGAVLNLQGTNEASRQAMADAAERYTAASAQLEQARSVAQCRQVIETAYEGLYYARAARIAMGLDPGPELPPLNGQQRAGAVTETRNVDVGGHHYSAAPNPSDYNAHYYPGGMVAGRPVPAGWYSEPWWKTALVAGAWGAGSALLFDTLFSGMHSSTYDSGFDAGFHEGVHDASGFDSGGWDGGWNGGGGDGGWDIGGGNGGDNSGWGF
ncbi:MAG: hypothetical protein JO100_12300 [Pseudonocardia sp.]|nr:hypothetical protein [Pseudonocardia sp.]